MVFSFVIREQWRDTLGRKFVLQGSNALAQPFLTVEVTRLLCAFNFSKTAMNSQSFLLISIPWHHAKAFATSAWVSGAWASYLVVGILSWPQTSGVVSQQSASREISPQE